MDFIIFKPCNQAESKEIVKYGTFWDKYNIFKMEM